MHFTKHTTRSFIAWFIALAAGFVPRPPAAQAQAVGPLAFTGAEGFGATAAGGRGGETVHVSNLNDSGPGSFRDAVSADHRIVVFDVGGYIRLKGVLRVTSNITIAGQTAPGDGVATLGSEISFSQSHDVVVRYIRFRQGLAENQDRKSAVNITGGKQMIFDHVSIEWGRWDTVDMNGCEDITFQNCLIGQGVAPQRFGCLCQCDRVTFSHNLFINNQSRNPKAKGKIQYINNVVYNWGVSGFVGGHSAADHTVDIINNYFIKGPQSSDHFLAMFKASDHVFQQGNFADLNKDGSLNGRPVLPADFSKADSATTAETGDIANPDKPGPANADSPAGDPNSPDNAPTLVTSPTNPSPVPVTVDSAERAVEKAIASAGDSLHRDAVDQRLIAQLKSLGKEGKIIHAPEEDGGPGEIPPAGRAAPLSPAALDQLLNNVTAEQPAN